MFAQVIQGKTSNPQAFDAAINQWLQDLAPGATGWLGSTSGVTEDGRAIAVVRFETEEDARRNSNRPEQDQWWSETAKLYDGEATFRDSTDVTVDLQGDPDQAGFVQVMQGRSSDPERARQLMEPRLRQVCRVPSRRSRKRRNRPRGRWIHHGDLLHLRS